MQNILLTLFGINNFLYIWFVNRKTKGDAMQSEIESILLDSDSYKFSHNIGYKEGTTSMMSYICSRGGRYDSTLFFGLQYYLKKYLTHRITMGEVEEAKEFLAVHGEPFAYEGWKYIAKDLGGKIPVRIRAVPEGSIVPVHNALVTVESTDPKVFWITSHLETSLLRSVWYPTTVASRSRFVRQIIWNFLEKSSDDPASEINFKDNDFGSRGVASQEAAMIGGAAHLVSSMGSDTIVGIRCANKYYNCKMAGFSIPALEHSVPTSWLRENEADCYLNFLNKVGKPGGMVAFVADSFDIYNACSNIFGDKLKQAIIDSKCTVIIRPDSGIPKDVVLNCLNILSDKFGYTLNKKRFKVINHNIRIIQGDGVNEKSIEEILSNAVDHGFSATNIALGMGGYRLTQLNRDTNKWAMKCCSVTTNKKEIDVFKDPITDIGKRSKKGRLDLILNAQNQYQTIQLSPGQISHPNSVMETVFENGEIKKEYSLDEIRDRANQGTICLTGE